MNIIPSVCLKLCYATFGSILFLPLEICAQSIKNTSRAGVINGTKTVSPPYTQSAPVLKSDSIKYKASQTYDQ